MKQMTKREFDLFRKLIYENLGISLTDKKVSLLQSRLGKLVKSKGLKGYKELYLYFTDSGNAQTDIELENAITTNVTSFFREAQQWVYLKEYLNTHIEQKKEKKLRIWSTASSSGEEPYSIAIFLQEHLKNFASWDIKILATDISDDILRKAMKGSYSEKEIDGVPKHIIHRYFNETKTAKGKIFTINTVSKKLITFRKFNLVYGDYRMFRNPIDIIFCRNVMIYFDKPVQIQIDTHLSGLLHKKGLLFIGHSESIPSGVGNLKLVKSSIYMKQ